MHFEEYSFQHALKLFYEFIKNILSSPGTLSMYRDFRTRYSKQCDESDSQLRILTLSKYLLRSKLESSSPKPNLTFNCFSLFWVNLPYALNNYFESNKIKNTCSISIWTNLIFVGVFDNLKRFSNGHDFEQID